MEFFGQIVTAVFIGYLSFTNSLADRIIALLPTDDTTETELVVETTASSTEELPTLPSRFSARIIPKILRESLSFQQAAVSTAVTPSDYTTDPLQALVNVFCTFTTDDYIRTTTGTGFFVHSDGVIMTNAHVAQFLLLGDTDLLGEAECVIRHGDPASIAYEAKLLYIPPAWVLENAAVVDAEVPTGTGERDYALLYVTESLTGEPLPAQFPALKTNTTLLPLSFRNAVVTAAGYPAGELIKQGASTPLIPRSAGTSVSELYTFDSNTADVFSIRGSIVGAEGSSGGPVLNADGEVVGMIVTRGDDTLDGPGSLRAITTSHIARTIEEETGFTFAHNISGNLPRRGEIFMETLAPFLLTLLENELQN